MNFQHQKSRLNGPTKISLKLLWRFRFITHRFPRSYKNEKQDEKQKFRQQISKKELHEWATGKQQFHEQVTRKKRSSTDRQH